MSEATEEVRTPPAVDLASLGITTGAEAQKDAYARILVLANYKVGKTTAIATTAPKPLIINCDGLGATTGAQHINSQFEDEVEFLVKDCNSSMQWAASVEAAYKLAEAGIIKTVAVDTATFLLASLKVEAENKKFAGFDLWNEVDSTFSKPWRKLLKIPAHLIVTTHITPGYEGEAGIAPSIQGSAKTKIPGAMHDIVLMDCVADRKPHERVFYVGPQGAKWSSTGCRNTKKSAIIEADFLKLFKELGIEP